MVRRYNCDYCHDSDGGCNHCRTPWGDLNADEATDEQDESPSSVTTATIPHSGAFTDYQAFVHGIRPHQESEFWSTVRIIVFALAVAILMFALYFHLI